MRKIFSSSFIPPLYIGYWLQGRKDIEDRAGGERFRLPLTLESCPRESHLAVCMFRLLATYVFLALWCSVYFAACYQFLLWKYHLNSNILKCWNAILYNYSHWHCKALQQIARITSHFLKICHSMVWTLQRISSHYLKICHSIVLNTNEIFSWNAAKESKIAWACIREFLL